jgi:flagellar hook-associated protein 3 FlgL
MRVAGTSFTDSMASQINLLAGRQYKLQNQATTGQSITAPEDDPAGMAQALGLQADQSNVAQYAQNISTLQNRSDVIANALQQLKTISDRVSELATQSSDTLSLPQELQANASETTKLIQQAVQIMNTKDGDQYLFGGTASGQPPFVATKDASGNVTGVTYQGNTSVTDHEIGQNSTISIDVPGANTSGTGARGVITDSRYGADFFNHMISLQNNLLAGNTNAIRTVDQPALSKDSDNIINQVSYNGAAQLQLEVAASAASTRKTSLNTSLTTVAGADLAETLTKLTQAQNAYQIALQSSSSIMQLRSSLLASLP